MLKVIKKYWYVLLIIAGVILWLWPRDNPSNIDISNDIKSIESTQSKIDSLTIVRDSIDKQIDTITITIEKTYIQYEKDRNIILNNNINEDYMFFSDYVEQQSSRLDSIYNS